MDEGRFKRLEAASNPRRASLGDAQGLARLYGSAFSDDPVFDYMVQPGAKRIAALELFFHHLLCRRDIPQGEVWMSSDGLASAIWLPPGGVRSPSGIFQQLRVLPLFVRVFGLARLGRAGAVAGAMETKHPAERHFYLAFMAVSPKYRGQGLGSAILEATLRRVDETGLPSYLENSNPKNERLYQRVGFDVGNNVSPPGAPPLIAMWRPGRPAAKAA